LLQELGHEVRDFGTESSETVDYPRFIRPTAEAVASGECERGIVLGGSGNGEAIVANRVRGVRCALCWNVDRRD
jgi:ribose 5-phosphate isomerase B